MVLDRRVWTHGRIEIVAERRAFSAMSDIWHWAYTITAKTDSHQFKCFEGMMPDVTAEFLEKMTKTMAEEYRVLFQRIGEQAP